MTVRARHLLPLLALFLVPAAPAAAVPPLPERPRPPAPQPAPGPAQRCSAELLPDGVETRFRGTWVDDDGFNFGYLLHITRRGMSLEGHFDWTLRVSGGHWLRNRVGDSAQEFVRGTVDVESCTLMFAGYRLTDASLIALDQYVVTVAPNGNLSGRTRGNDAPYWAPRISGRRTR